MTKLKEIFEAEKLAKEAKDNYDELFLNYIKENVDINSWDSLDKAIMELPENINKMVIYDAMYDLEGKKIIDLGKNNV